MGWIKMSRSKDSIPPCVCLLLEGVLAAFETLLTFVLLGGFAGSSAHCTSEDGPPPL